jgi:hypothetical protein
MHSGYNAGMNRLQEKHDLFIKLGMLFGPLQRIVEHPEQYDEQEQSEAIARYCAEWEKLAQDMRQYSVGQPLHNYSIQFERFYEALNGLRHWLKSGRELKDSVGEAIGNAQRALDSIPVPSTSVILEAGSQFTAYCRLRELCEADATKSLVWLDPYIAANVFNRYVGNVRDGVPVTLVTSEPAATSGKRNKQRWDDFLDVSRLFAAERGPAWYRLIVNPKLHDRWAVFDDKRIYSLGGSSKDAADTDYFTIAAVEGTPANLKSIQDHIDNGTEYFGPSTPAHK